VIDRGSLDAWEIKGSKSTEERARERVEALLPTCPPSPLLAELRAELRRIASRAAQRFGMEALPDLPE